MRQNSIFPLPLPSLVLHDEVVLEFVLQNVAYFHWFVDAAIFIPRKRNRVAGRVKANEYNGLGLPAPHAKDDAGFT